MDVEGWGQQNKAGGLDSPVLTRLPLFANSARPPFCPFICHFTESFYRHVTCPLSSYILCYGSLYFLHPRCSHPSVSHEDTKKITMFRTILGRPLANKMSNWHPSVSQQSPASSLTLISIRRSEGAIFRLLEAGCCFIQSSQSLSSTLK